MVSTGSVSPRADAAAPRQSSGAAVAAGAPVVAVIEDDQTLLAALRYNLELAGYEAALASDGEKGLELVRMLKPDLVLLDLMLPGMDGLDVCRVLRKETAIPIIILTARAEEVDKVVGLELGADDYVTKPFSMKELVARVRSHLRRSELHGAAALQPNGGQSHLMAVGDLAIDTARREALKAGLSVNLRAKEFELLAFFIANRGIAFTRDQLLQRIWGYDYSGETRTVDVHIGRLRGKIEDDPHHPVRLITLRGLGYRFNG